MLWHQLFAARLDSWNRNLNFNFFCWLRDENNRRHDTQHNDIHHNDTQHDTTEAAMLSVAFIYCYTECRMQCVYMLSVIIPNVTFFIVKLSAIMLIVVAPSNQMRIEKC
jgi:hypothetical protein